MNPPILDEMIEGTETVDPTHLMALATRVKTLADADASLREEFGKLVKMLDERLPTKEEMIRLRVMLSDETGREYLRKKLNRWGVGGVGLFAALYATSPWLSRFFSWLASLAVK